MKKVFVTGANGFLGTNLVLALIDHGYMVKALLRNLNSFINFSHSNLELIKGDLFDTELLMLLILRNQASVIFWQTKILSIKIL